MEIKKQEALIIGGEEIEPETWSFGVFSIYHRQGKKVAVLEDAEAWKAMELTKGQLLLFIGHLIDFCAQMEP